MTQEAYMQDLTRMCYNNAVIASSKFRYVKRAMLSLFTAIVPWVLLVYDVFRYYPVQELLGK